MREKKKKTYLYTYLYMSEHSITLITQYKRAFDIYDTDADGCITPLELERILQSLGRCPTQGTCREMVQKRAKQNLPDLLTWEDVLDILKLHPEETCRDMEANLRKAWHVLDRDGDGWIPTSELSSILSTMAESLNEDEMKQVIHMADPNGQGRVHVDHWVTLMIADLLS